MSSRAHALLNTKDSYNPAIDGLRAIAVLAVLVYHLHSNWLPGGFAGVDVFFVISGYVVTGSLVRHPVHNLGEFLLDFYSRRFRRILPALLACLIVTVGMTALFVPNAWLSDTVQETALSAFFGLSNFALLAGNDGYFATRAEFNPFTHTWSLAVEEQFYLLYPLLLFAGLRTRGAAGLRAIKILLALLIAGSLAWSAWTSKNLPGHAYFMLTSRFWELGCGALLFLARGRLNQGRLAYPPMHKAGFCLGVVLIAGSLFMVSPTGFPFPGALPAVFGTVLVIWSVTQGSLQRWVPGAALASRPMLAVGLRSYSLYLWHWPVFVLFRWTVGLDLLQNAVLALALTFLLADLSYRCVEGPFQRGKLLAGWPSIRTVTAGIVVVVAAWGIGQQIYAHQSDYSLSVVMRQANDWYPHPHRRSHEQGVARCAVIFSSRRVDTVGRVQEFVPSECKAAPAAAGRLFVIGDSHASAYRRMFHMLAETSGVPVTLLPEGGCAVAALFETEGRRKAGCAAFQQFALEYVASHIKPGDVVFLASLRVPRLPDGTAALAAGPLPGPTELQAKEMELAFAQAQAVVQRLERQGAIVMLDAPKPVFAAPAFRCSDWFNRMNAVCAPGLSISRSGIQAHRQGVMDALARLQAAHPQLVIWDPLPVLCPGVVCEAVDQGRPLFFDGDHITGLANERLLSEFRALVLGVLGYPLAKPLDR